MNRAPTNFHGSLFVRDLSLFLTAYIPGAPVPQRWAHIQSSLKSVRLCNGSDPQCLARLVPSRSTWWHSLAGWWWEALFPHVAVLKAQRLANQAQHFISLDILAG